MSRLRTTRSPAPSSSTSQAGKVPSPDANTAPSDHKTVARLGDTVTVLDVYENWNGVSGLTVAYVYVHATGYHTHLSAGEMGITEPCGPDALPARQRAAELADKHEPGGGAGQGACRAHASPTASWQQLPRPRTNGVFRRTAWP